MNTTTLEPTERKAAKRAARKKAAPKAARPTSVARGSMKKKIRKMAQGTRKR